MSETYLEIEEFKRVKTFMYSMNLFELTLKERAKFLEDKRLTQVEKKILSCSILLRECRYEEIITEISLLAPSNILIESQKLLILGICYSSLSDFHKALSYLERARNILERLQIRKYEFYALLHLFYTFHNLKDQKGMKEILLKMDELESYKNLGSNDQISILRCRFSYYSFLDHHLEAEKALNKINSRSKEMHPSQYSAHLIDEFIFYIKTDEWEKCELTLKRMTKSRLFHHSQNYKFIKAFFHHLKDKSPLYIYEKDFQSTPILYYQIIYIKALESADQARAEFAWSELAKISPQIYKENREYAGDKCLFSLCLNLYGKSSGKIEEKICLENKGSLEERLTHLFITRSGSPLPKEEIFRTLWEHSPQSKDDFNKLARLVNRVRNNSKLTIICRKGCYLVA